MTFKRNDQGRTSIINGATDNAKRIGAMLDRIKANSESLSYLIETAALSCILCAVKHGDVNSATLLVTKTLHAGVDRSRAVANWMQLHGPMTWEAKDKGFKLNKSTRASYLENYERDPKAFKARIVDADSGPFYVLTKPSKPVSFNLLGRLQAVLKEAHRYADGEKTTDGKLDIRGIDAADNFLREMERALRIGDTDASARKAEVRELLERLSLDDKAGGDTPHAIEDQSDLIEGEAIEMDGGDKVKVNTPDAQPGGEEGLPRRRGKKGGRKQHAGKGGKNRMESDGGGGENKAA